MVSSERTEVYDGATAGVLALGPDVENATLQNTNTGWSPDGAYFAMTERVDDLETIATTRVVTITNGTKAQEYVLDYEEIVDAGLNPIPTWSDVGHHLLYPVKTSGQQYVVSMPDPSANATTGSVQRVLLNRGPLAGKAIDSSRWIPGTSLLLIIEGDPAHVAPPLTRYLFDAQNPDQEPVLQEFLDEDGQAITPPFFSSILSHNGSWEAFGSSSGPESPLVHLANPRAANVSLRAFDIDIDSNEPFLPGVEFFAKRPKRDFFGDEGALYSFGYGSEEAGIAELHYVRCADDTCDSAQRIFPYSSSEADNCSGFLHSSDERYVLLGTRTRNVSPSDLQIHMRDLRNDDPGAPLPIDPNISAFQGGALQLGWLVQEVADSADEAPASENNAEDDSSDTPSTKTKRIENFR